jgi:DNA-binding NarL/FixJ family response regulator
LSSTTIPSSGPGCAWFWALPGINGLEGIPRLKALAPTLRVILISAYRDQADLLRTAAAQAGAETFVVKDDLGLGVVQDWK